MCHIQWTANTETNRGLKPLRKDEEVIMIIQKSLKIRTQDTMLSE